MKKAQVTVFIIIGILLLVISAIIFYITSFTVSEEFDAKSVPVTETVPQEFVALQTYTESCLGSVAEQGLIILGQQGGYIYPSTVGEFSITNPTDSDGINLDPLLIPYWHYNSQLNGNSAVTISSLQPSLDDADDYMSIVEQLGRYIKEEILDCLNDYQTFDDEGYNVTFQVNDVTARVWDGYLDFILEMPLEASRGDESATMETFYTTIDLDLMHYYEVADEIAQVERNSTFLENQALNLLYVYSGYDMDKFPPTEGNTFNDFDSLFWTATDLESDLESILTSYVPLLRYYGSDNFIQYNFPGSEHSDLYQRVTDNMILPLTGAEDLSVSFNYFSSWDSYFNINGGEELIEPQNIYYKSPLPIYSFDFTTQNYYNTYDFSYPVLITLEDPIAFNNKGYTFNFALESNIINNDPIDPDYVQPDVQVAGGGSLACDPNQATTELVKTIVVDAYSKESLDLVKIGLEIPGIDYCTIGNTDEEGVLEESYPAVFGGLLELSKDGYLTEFYDIDTYFYNDESAIFGYAVDGLDDPVLEMYPKKTVNARINKIPLNKCVRPRVCNLDKEKCDEEAGRFCFFNSGSGLFLPNSPVHTELHNGSWSGNSDYYIGTGETSLEDNEDVMIMLERVSDVDSEIQGADFMAFIQTAGSDLTEVELVPGLYKMTVSAILNDGVFISEDERCMTNRKKDCQNFTSSYIEGTLTSTYTMNESTELIEITADDLYNHDTIEFSVLAQEWLDVPETFTSIDDDGNDVEINGRLMEDLSVVGYFPEIINDANLYSRLQPTWPDSDLEEES